MNLNHLSEVGVGIESPPPQISSHQFRTPWLHYSSLSPLNYLNPRQTSDYLINIQYWKHFKNSQHSKACCGWMEIIKALFKCGSCAKVLHSCNAFQCFYCFCLVLFLVWSYLNLRQCDCLASNETCETGKLSWHNTKLSFW